jgi:membrane-bound serine protease (ClpP class)
VPHCGVRVRLSLAALGGLLIVASWCSLALAQPARTSGRIDVVQVNGLLDPSNAALIQSTIRDAEAVDSDVLVFQLDGSGAIDTDVDKLVELVRNSKVPIAAWIGPSGGGARGATAVIAQAAGYAAIAHGADFGPVDPIYYDDPGRTVPAAADLQGKEVTIEESTLQDFVASLDGKTINGVKVTTLKGDPGERTLSTNVHFHKLYLSQQLAHKLNTPWIAYFLFVAGLLLIVFEFFSASIGIAGVVGAFALVGGCFGFSHLPVNLWAIGLLLVGVFGLSIDVQAGGLGAWTFIGGGSMIAGSLFLYGGSTQLNIPWWALLIVIGGTLIFMLSAMTAMVRARFSTPTIGREELVGEMGKAEADVAPDGLVRVRNALWRARTNRATPIHAGDRVRVVAVEGIVLEVEPETGGARDYRERRRS